MLAVKLCFKSGVNQGIQMTAIQIQHSGKRKRQEASLGSISRLTFINSPGRINTKGRLVLTAVISICAAQTAVAQKSEIQVSKQTKSADIKAEAGKAAPPIFSIEVPGPSQKSSANTAKTGTDDPKSREQAASQFFKDKQKQTISANPQVKEASMRLSGSLCPACLKALAARFQKTEGVINASVELPSQMKASETETSNAIGKLPRYAIAHVTFDAKVLTVERIKDIIRTNDLAFWKFEVSEK